MKMEHSVLTNIFLLKFTRQMTLNKGSFASATIANKKTLSREFTKSVCDVINNKANCERITLKAGILSPSCCCIMIVFLCKRKQCASLVIVRQEGGQKM